MPSGATVIKIQRVRLSDGVPLSFDETYLPENLGRRVMTDDLAREPIFTLLEERYDTPLVEAEYVLEAAAAEPDVAAALEIPVGSPVFLIERTSYTSGHRAVDYEDCTTEATPFGSRRAWPGEALPARRSAIDMLATSVPVLSRSARALSVGRSEWPVASSSSPS